MTCRTAINQSFRHEAVLHQDCRNDLCPLCVGGLFMCLLCGGTEASLPTDCPGEALTNEQAEGILNGRLDFRGGHWVVP